MCRNTGFGALPLLLDREWAGQPRLLAAVSLAQLEHRRSARIGSESGGQGSFRLGGWREGWLNPPDPFPVVGREEQGAPPPLGAFTVPGVPLLGSPTQPPPREHMTAASLATWTA